MTPTTPARSNATRSVREQIPAAWRAVLQEIGRLAAREHVSAHAVGGCVRDWLLGRPVTELDIMIEGDSIALARVFAAAHRGMVTEHPQFRTATVEYTSAKHTQRVDFAACRKETYSKIAVYPKVSTGTIHEDLLRRDFTVNAMAVSLLPTAFGQLIDIYGGRADLEARLIRVLHPRSFQDDPSRMLRAIRFAQRLTLTIEPQTAGWMRVALQDNLLARLNRGRLRKELLAMLEEPDPLACLQALGEWLTGARGR